MSKTTTVASVDIAGRTRGAQKLNSGSEEDQEKAADMLNVLTELKALRADFNSKFDTTNGHLRDMTNAIGALEQSMVDMRNVVDSNTTRITEAEERISSLEDDLEVAKADLASANKRITTLESRTVNLDNRGRRKNLRLFGLPENAEQQQPLLEFIQRMLPRWLELGSDRNFILERAHRTFAQPRPGQNRAAIIRFLKFQDREMVFNTAKQLNIQHGGSKLVFVADLSAETMRQRNEFNVVRKKYMDKGLYRGFQIHPCRLRVLHDGKIQLFATPREAEDFYLKITSNG